MSTGARDELRQLIDSSPDWAVAVLLWIARRTLEPGKVHRKDVETAQAHVECATDYAVKAVHELLAAGPGAVASPSGIRPARGAR